MAAKEQANNASALGKMEINWLHPPKERGNVNSSGKHERTVCLCVSKRTKKIAHVSADSIVPTLSLPSHDTLSW